MLLEQLELADFRNYRSSRFRFAGDRVVFTGPNGIGKTNLLESISVLSILRSFRTVSGREMVRIGSRGFDLRGRIEKEGGLREELRVTQSLSGRRETFIGPNRIRRSSEFIREFRTVVFVPEDRNITGGSSSFRRRFFDMLISTLDSGYLTALSNYHRALMQRNHALKSPQCAAAAAAAFESSVICKIPIELIYQWMSTNNKLAMFFIKLLAIDLGISDQRTVNLTQKHIRGRLAEALLFLKDSYGLEEDGATLSIYLSREDLANLSNMTTSNAIRTLSNFATEKLIIIDGRKIKLIDEERLKKISKIG